MLQTQDLFDARTGGYHIYRIPGILVTPGGAVLATAEARLGTGGDYDDIDLLLRRSTDGGLTWDSPRKLIGHERYGPGPMNNCSMIADRLTGAIHLLCCHDYARVFYLRSEDDGLTFTEPVEITASFEAFREVFPWRVVATGPGHALQLESGRLLVPTWMSTGGGTEFGPGKRGHRPSAIMTLYSDDHGASWQCGELVAGPEWGNPSESIAEQLSDGRVILNIRTEGEYHNRLISISEDGISGWSEPRPDEALLEPICMAGFIRWEGPDGGVQAPALQGKRRFLFANPDNLDKTMSTWAYDRKRLTVKVSYDECQTWPLSRVLEPGPAGYSDLAVLPDGTILCLFERGDIEHMGDVAHLTLARFDFEWLNTGRE